MPILFIFSGLPGVGKSSIARALAQRIRGVYFRVDSAEDALAKSVLNIAPAEDAGYQIGYAIAIDNLKNGLDVIADCVNPINLTRDAWMNAAKENGAKWVNIEIICTDIEIHKRRVFERIINLPNQNLPNWEDVENRHYEEWSAPRLILDSAKLSPNEAVEEIIKFAGLKSEK